MAVEGANASTQPSTSAAATTVAPAATNSATTVTAGTVVATASTSGASTGGASSGGTSGSSNNNGVINLSLPLGATDTIPSAPAATAPAATTASTASTTVAAADATAAATPTSYQIWIGTLHSEGDARLYWTQEVQRFPDLLKSLGLSLRQVDLGASQGIWFKVLGGPVASSQAADRICQSIKARSPLDDCRVLPN